MLAQSRAKADRLGIRDRCAFVQADFLAHDFDPAAYNTVLVGFFLSHLTETQERLLFDALQIMLDSSGRFLILDSAWSPERSKFNAKVERQPRRLNDGTAFEIYKRYCDQGDISRWARDYGVKLDVEHSGSAFYAVSGTFSGT
jgi:ubiquinone/menaquinone biosynthesis C-methylase UbiE